jgi:hypothetical protein
LASTVGLQGFGRSRLRVVADVAGAGELRLVVQVFGRNGGWPLGAAERVATPAELRQGLDVQVLHEGAEVPSRVLAWVEPNARELEFGALTAVPHDPLAMTERAARAGSDELVLEVAKAAAAAA